MAKTFKTPQDYIESIRDGRVIYADGEKITDVMDHPVTRHGALSYSRQYARFHDPAVKDIFTAPDPETGEPVDLFLTPPRSADDLLRRAKALALSEELGYGGAPALSDAMLSLFMVSQEIAEANPMYKANIDNFYRRFREEDLIMAIAMSDTKGDRSLHPGQQSDPDLYVRKVEERDDGIVIRGMKAHITGAAYMHELVVMPTKKMRPDESDYSVTCIVSPGTEGVKLLMRPRRMVGSDFEYPVSHDEPGAECFVWFDDVFVPWERVIQNGEDWLSQPIARGLGLLLRYSALCSMKHTAEVLAGAAYLLAQYNGVEKAPHIRDHFFEFAMLASAMDAFVTSAAMTCTMSDGMAIPNGVITNVAKYMFTDKLSDMYKHLIDIGGAIIATQPWESDYNNPELHSAFRKYLSGGDRATADQRMRLYNFVRDIAADEYASHFLMTEYHGAGSPQAQKMMTIFGYDFDAAAEKVRRLARIEE